MGLKPQETTMAKYLGSKLLPPPGWEPKKKKPVKKKGVNYDR